MKDRLTFCRAFAMLFMLTAIACIFLGAFAAVPWFVIASLIYQVGGFVIEEIRNARV